LLASLICKFFQIIDALYPVVPRGQFHAEYERFWTLSDHDKSQVDPSMVALHFVMYASATQYLQVLEPAECAQTAEFYSMHRDQWSWFYNPLNAIQSPLHIKL